MDGAGDGGETRVMRSETVETGRCMCGAVTYTVIGPLREVTNCYCVRCRRFTGHHMAATAAAVADLSIEDQGRRLTWHPVPGAEYGFCSACGSSLFWRSVASPGVVSICAGSVEPPTGLRTIEAWWASQASDYFTRPDVPERETE
jgi:hypothetical protein